MSLSTSDSPLASSIPPPIGLPCSDLSPIGEGLSTERLLEACIHCGMCLNTCPTYLVTGSEAESPRGRLYLMKKWEEGALSSANQLSSHLDNCLGCLNCQTACPSGVQYGQLLNHYKETLSPLQARTLGQRITRWVKRAAFKWLLPHRLMLELMGWSLRFYKASGLQTLVRVTGLLRLTKGLAHLESLTPTMPPQTPMLHPGQRFGPPNAPLVGLHIGCMMDTVFRPVHWATIAVLVANGYGVFIPPQACCGALAHHAGETDIARALARQNLDRLLATPMEAIVFNSAGCGAEMKDYSHLFEPSDPYHAKALELAAKTQDITQLLAQKPLAPMSCPVAQTVTYHAACHLHHAQQVQTQPVDLLQQVPSLTLIPLAQAELCCGSGGIFNLEHPDISEPVLALKMERIQATGAACIATGNPGCTLQLQHGVTLIGGNQTVVHPIEILAQAYGPQPGVFSLFAKPTADS